MSATSQPKIRVGICGAAGKMGREVVKAVLMEPDLTLVMAVDPRHTAPDVALMAGWSEACGVAVVENLAEALAQTQPDVVVEFTNPASVLKNSLTILHAGVRCIIGSTGLQPDDITELTQVAQAHGTAVLIAPNFAIGAVLLMKFAQEASRYFNHAEIIELHHNQKHDAPSGSALRTAELMQAVQPQFGLDNLGSEKELLPGARGGKTGGNIHIHSVRLPGLVAHQEVIFGGIGQTLTLRHDSLDRASFMPGVILAIRQLMQHQGLVHGLEHLL